LSSAVRTRAVSRRLLLPVLLGGVATVTAIIAEGQLGLFEPGLSVNLWLGMAPGVVWLGAGIVAWGLRPASPAGPLMTAVGFSYFAPSLLSLPREPLAFTLGLLLWGLPLAFAAHLYVVFPVGARKSALERRLIAFAYLFALVPWFVHALFRDPVRDFRCSACPENLLLVEANTGAADAVIAIGNIAGIGLGVAIAVLLVRRWQAATPTARRALAPVLGAALVTVLLFFPFLAFSRLGEPISPWGMIAWLGSGLVPLAFLVGLLRTRLQQGGVAELVVELGAAPPAERIRELLARTLGDPSVQLAFWRPGAGDYVDAAGATVALPESDGERAVSIIDHRGIRLAALIHDRSLLENPRLLDGVSAAARLALENARLQAELRAQLREVRASRGRIVEAGDQERRRIERNLHDGAQQRLLAIRLALRVARKNAGDLEPQLAEIDAELAGALQELRTLARGLHPPILTEEGLGPALETLARRAAIPVEIGAVPSVRLPSAVETAAYYVASEALANAVKHAHASHVRVDLGRSGSHAVVEVTDDGVGGADPQGSGLRGLRDRVEALDGSLAVESEQGQGTRLRAAFPCA
jgi:signal transduction histidine kinase